MRGAAIAALESGPLGYHANGLVSLRSAIAAHYARTLAIEVDPVRVVVTTGSSAAFTAIILASFEAGDAVAMTRPGYPAYRNVLGALGCRVVELDCGPDTGFQPTVEMLDAAPSHPRG